MPEAPTPHPYRQHTPTCLNCGAATPDPYCSICGQEASDYRISARLFFRELLDALTLDSKFFRSLGPLLFKPGHLTIAFAEGKRARYLRPLRLYLFTSFLFFVGAGMLLNQSVSQLDSEQVAEDFLTFYTDSLGVPLEADVRETMIGAAESLENFPETQSRIVVVIAQEAVKDGLPDTTASRLVAEVRAALADSTAVRAAAETDSLATTPGTEPGAEPEAGSKPSLLDRLFSSILGTGDGQIDPRALLRSFVGNIPALLFFMVPFFALTLKLLYARRNRLYVEHLVFGFHTHAFLFLLIGMALVTPFVPTVVFVIAGFVYLMVAARRVYRQGWWKTYFKVTILLAIYFIVLLIGFIVTFIVSLLFARLAEEGRTILDVFS